MSTFAICVAILVAGLMVALTFPYGLLKKYEDLRKRHDKVDATICTVVTFRGFCGMNAVFNFQNKHPDKNIFVQVTSVKTKRVWGADYTLHGQSVDTVRVLRGGQSVLIECPMPPVDGGWVTGVSGWVCFEGEPSKLYNVDFDC